MRNPMDSSQRLTDGTRWRTFMRLLLLDDLITSYTHARPGVGLLVVDLDLGTARYPYGGRPDSGAPMNGRQLRAVTGGEFDLGGLPGIQPCGLARTCQPSSVLLGRFADFITVTAFFSHHARQRSMRIQ